MKYLPRGHCRCMGSRSLRAGAGPWRIWIVFGRGGLNLALKLKEQHVLPVVVFYEIRDEGNYCSLDVCVHL